VAATQALLCRDAIDAWQALVLAREHTTLARPA